jgi:hypothetical protein
MVAGPSEWAIDRLIVGLVGSVRDEGGACGPSPAKGPNPQLASSFLVVVEKLRKRWK